MRHTVTKFPEAIAATVIIALLFQGLSIFIPTVDKKNKPQSLAIRDTIKRLSDLKTTTAILKLRNGTITVYRANNNDPREETSGRERDIDWGENYYGTTRALAKLDYSNANYQIYSSMTALMATIPTDTLSRATIKKHMFSRTPYEQRNVRITDCYLFAIAREEDNDFHCIVGNYTRIGQPTVLMNCEISGLPPQDTFANYTVFRSVRDSVESYLGSTLQDLGYFVFSTPLRISIEGSLFFDTDHRPGTIGPAGYNPQTAWEIHPISKLVFKDF